MWFHVNELPNYLSWNIIAMTKRAALFTRKPKTLTPFTFTLNALELKDTPFLTVTLVCRESIVTVTVKR